MNREKCIELSRAIMDARREIKSLDETIYDWFEQNPLKPTLPNGKDLYNFADFIRCRYELDYSNEFIQGDISAWFEEGLKQEPVVVGLSDEQEFWASAPKWANWYVEDLYGCHYWFENEPVPFNNEWKSQGGNSKKIAPVKRFWHSTLRQRPKPPAPRVEVGQVWSYGVFDVRVIGVNAIVVAYQGINNNDIETTDIRYFLAKFERVGGSE
jgi:hypothetical protein